MNNSVTIVHGGKIRSWKRGAGWESGDELLGRAFGDMHMADGDEFVLITDDRPHAHECPGHNYNLSGAKYIWRRYGQNERIPGLFCLADDNVVYSYDDPRYRKMQQDR